jgi:acyl-CoA synthetase (AMP-forming)/AMP-acid ligase II
MNTPRTSSCLAGDLALEPMSWSWTNQEGKLKPDKQVSWPLAAPTSCAVIGTNRKKPTSPFETGCFGPGTIGFQDANVYFFILDRVKDMIVTGGENVYSGEVEAVIYAHPAVREVVVFGIPDPKWGKS